VNPVVLQIASGNAFFIGMGLTVIAFALRLWLNGRVWVSLLTVGWLVGISLVILSATPMSWWLYGLWFAFCVAVRMAFIVRTSFQLKPTTGSTLHLIRVFGVFRGNPSFRWMLAPGFSIIAP
jgi:hypothetical protein